MQKCSIASLAIEGIVSKRSGATPIAGYVRPSPKAIAGELARVEQIGRDLANARRLGEIGDVERASQAIRHYIDRVRTARQATAGSSVSATSMAWRWISSGSLTKAS